MTARDREDPREFAAFVLEDDDPTVVAYTAPEVKDLAARLRDALTALDEVTAERDRLAASVALMTGCRDAVQADRLRWMRIAQAAEPCVDALRDIAPDAHAALLDVYDAARGGDDG